MKQIVDIRGYGMLGGFDLAPGERPGVRGTEAQKKLFHAGMHIKFTGDSGIIAPAFIASKKDIDEMIRILREVISTF